MSGDNKNQYMSQPYAIPWSGNPEDTTIVSQERPDLLAGLLGSAGQPECPLRPQLLLPGQRRLGAVGAACGVLPVQVASACTGMAPRPAVI
jgi:hypothetical protein